MTQAEFAEEIGLSTRGYYNRITNQREWKIEELIRASMWDDGCVKVETGIGVYNITIGEDK